MDFNSIVGNAAKKMTNMAKSKQRAGSGSGEGNSNSDNPLGAKSPERPNPHEGPSYSGYTVPTGKNTFFRPEDIQDISDNKQIQGALAQITADTMFKNLPSSFADFASQAPKANSNVYTGEKLYGKEPEKSLDYLMSNGTAKGFDVTRDPELNEKLGIETANTYDPFEGLYGTESESLQLGNAMRDMAAGAANITDLGYFVANYPEAFILNQASNNRDRAAAEYTGGIPTRAQLYESFYNNPEALSGLNDEWGTMYRSGTDTRADAPKEIYKDYVRRTGANKLWGLDAMEAWQAEHPYTPVSPDDPDALMQNAMALLPYMGGTVGNYIGGIGGFDKAFDPWYDYYKENLDLRNINNDQWTQELIAGMNDAEARDFADWLVADRYGANGELYNWASAVIPDYLKGTGNYDPNSDSMYMLNKTSYEPGSQEALEQQSRIADMLYLQRISQLMQDENNKTPAIPSTTIDRLSKAAGGGFRTVSDSYNGSGKKITPYSGKIKDWGYEDLLDNINIKDELTARDILNVLDESTGEYPYRGNQIVKE